MSHFSDEEIIANVINGDVNRFAEIVDRYQNNVYSIGIRFFRNSDDACDFAQDVFIKAFRNLEQFKGRSSFKYWLIKIAYNYGISKVKNKIEEVQVNEYIIPDMKGGPDEKHFKNELNNVIKNAVEKLPDKYKVCVDMYFYLGLSYKEIGAITEFPVNTIKSHVMRAKHQLREFLKGTIAEEYYDNKNDG
jgi:RNA polymerase sigma-70 factor (ECF subfamily)